MESTILYKQIPMLNSNCRCRLCKRVINDFQTVKVLIYNSSNMTTKEITAKLHYCDNCGICYADSKIFSSIRDANTGYSAYGFMISGKMDIDIVSKRICSYPDGFSDTSIESKGYVHLHQGFRTIPIRSTNINGTVFVSNIEFNKCPICGLRVHDYVLAIPISTEIGARYNCRSCGAHHFIQPSEDFVHLIKDNPFAKGIDISCEFFFNYFDQAKHILWQKDEHYMMLLLKPPKGGGERYIIISNYSDCSQDIIKVLSYKGKEARQILTDIHKNKLTRISFDGEEYEIYKTVYNNKFHSSGFYTIVPSITIKPSGGYYQSVKNNNRYELVDVLMYSPFTGRYEIARATYNKDDKDYFIDINAFRRFYREYGNPGLNIFAEEKYQYGTGDLRDLRDESMLHAFGYNVNARESLSSAFRQSLLADIIDLEVMSQKSVIALLESLIRRFTAARYNEARFKWQQDLKFVINYKANPQRFIIAKA